MPNQTETESADLASKHVCSQQQGTNWGISSYQVKLLKRWELAIPCSPRSTRTRTQKEGCKCSRKKTESFTRSSHRSRWNSTSRDPKSRGCHTSWRKNSASSRRTKHAIGDWESGTCCQRGVLSLPEGALPETCPELAIRHHNRPFSGPINKSQEILTFELSWSQSLVL